MLEKLVAKLASSFEDLLTGRTIKVSTKILLKLPLLTSINTVAIVVDKIFYVQQLVTFPHQAQCIIHLLLLDLDVEKIVTGNSKK